jgi:uncharacterized protein (UPF0276 family)
MFLAINFSSPAARLAQSGAIELDYFKTPDWAWMVDEAKKIRPVTVHFTLEAGNDNLSTVDWNAVESLARSTNTPFINLHLDSRQRYYPDIPVTTTNKSDTKRIFKALLSDVQNIAARFGSERIIVENSPYRGNAGNTLRPCVEPDLITQIVEETGCGFLLDISHAIITAHYIDMGVQEYFSHLPVHSIKEMHFAGIHHIKGQWVDHLSIQKKDWQHLDWVLEHIQSGDWSSPWLLAYEYGGVGAVFTWRCDPQVIAKQMPMLYKRVKRLRLNFP